MSDIDKYKDIINLSYDGVFNHAKMSIENRAAQFSSFAALKGYDESLTEINRKTINKKVLGVDEIYSINKSLNKVKNKILMKPEVEINYFVADKLKAGGEYKKITAKIKFIDDVNGEIVTAINQKIKFEDIIYLKVKDTN